MGALPLRADWRPPGFGLVTTRRRQAFVELYGLLLDVSCNGQSLVGRCIACDDREGWATAYEWDLDGRSYQRDPTTGRLVVSLLRGAVNCRATVANTRAGADLATAANPWAAGVHGPVTDPVSRACQTDETQTGDRGRG